ncbi:MAG: hypothetical protein HDS87_00850, partial [Bacteroidales bacterium]|nr:hypothetical protein [Bacteroidales bacterium]
MANESTKWLYDQLKGKGYNVGKDENEFDSLMRTNADSRKWAYETATKSGLNVGKDIDEFSSLVGGNTQTSAPSSTPATPVENVKSEKQANQPKKQQAWKPTPLQKAFMLGQLRSTTGETLNMMNDAVDNTRRVVRSFTQEGRDKQKAGEMTARIAGKYNKPLGISPPASTGGVEVLSGTHSQQSPTVYGVKKVDGELKTEYLLPDGSLTTDFTKADSAEYTARKARLQHQFERRMTQNGLDPSKQEDIEKQRQKDLLDESEKRVAIRLANNEDNLHEIETRRAIEFDESNKWNKNEGFWDNMTRILGSNIRRGIERQHPINRPQESLTEDDRNARTFIAENGVLNEAKNLLETRQLKKSSGFMGGFWNIANNWRNMKMGARHAAGDVDLYSGGLMSLQKATQLLNMENKLKQGEDLSDAEVSMLYSTMLGQDVRHNIETPHGYNAAQITVEMFPFMAQMMLNPASGLSSALVRKFGKNGLKKVAMTIIGDVAESAVLANTLQAPKTTGDIIERHLGEVTETGRGKYAFKNGLSWGEAIAKGEGAAVIENYTEMLGEHFGIIKDFAGKWIGKGVSKLGGGRIVEAVTNMTTKIKTSDWGKAIGNLESRAHWNGTIGEVLEEEAGIVLNSIFTGDNKFSDLVDADQQIDIVLGVGLFGGFISTVKSIGYPMARAKAKSELRRAESIGGWRFADAWDGIRSEIDNAEETELAETVRNLVSAHANSKEQMRAIMNYAKSLMKARGVDLALAQATAEGNITPEQQDAEESFSHGESITESGEEEAMLDVKKNLDMQRKRLVAATSEDFVVKYFDSGNALENLTQIEMSDDLRGIALDYMNAQYVYDGMIQRVRDDIDGRIAQSDAMIDSRVNRETGMIHPATMKIDDRKVYIVNGTVSMYEDGTGVDTENSSESIIIRDAETGKIEFADPAQVLNIGEAIDSESEKEAARAQITQEMAQEAANNIDGVLSFAPGETYSVLDIDGNQEPITILGQSADENGSPREGFVDIQYADGTIQAVATSDLQQWVDAANEKRVSQFAEERDAERAAEDEAERQAEESGLNNPNRDRALLPDNWKMPYYEFNTIASRYIESERGTGGILYQDEQGNDAIVISAIDNNSYVGYFREYDEQGRPTNRWSAKFQNGSGLRENYRDMMQTAQELLPAGHELTEHTSVSTDGLRNLANQLKHGYELQYDEQGNVITTEVMINMMARENELGISDYESGSIEPARVSSEEYKEAATRLIPYMEALGLSKFNIHWENGYLYVDHPILKRADTPQQQEATNTADESTRAADTDKNDSSSDNLMLDLDVARQMIEEINAQQEAGELSPDENVDNVASSESDMQSENAENVPNTVENTEMSGQGVPKVEKFGEGGIIITPDIALTDEEVAAALAGEETTTPSEPKPSAISQIPTNEQGDPIYEQVDADLAWDGLMEETEDEQVAQNVIAQEIAEREEALKKLEKQKPKTGLSTREKIKAEKNKKQAMDDIRRSIEHWKRMATTKQRRQAEEDSKRAEEARRHAEERRTQAEREKAEREEAERIAIEAQNGVLDWRKDTAEAARARGFRMVDGERVDRQEEEDMSVPEGREASQVRVKFDNKNQVDGVMTVIEASELQPSHLNGRDNPRFMIPEAQPKTEFGSDRISSAEDMAKNMNPEEITGGVTAFTGAPVVNRRKESIQGTGRSNGLRIMWESYPERAEAYREYLIELAKRGLVNKTPEEIMAMKQPVNVRMLDVDDAEAIRLGNISVDSTESGGHKRIEAQSTSSSLAANKRMGEFFRRLFEGTEEDMSLTECIRENGYSLLGWMAETGVITNTQYKSALTNLNNKSVDLTEDSVADIRKIVELSFFEGAPAGLKDAWRMVPDKAQRAVLATSYRDYDSEPDMRIRDELHHGVEAFAEMSSYPGFAEATNLKDALAGAESWASQYSFGENGETLLNREKYSNFALHIAALFKGLTQKELRRQFNEYYDLVQEKHELSLEDMMEGKTEADFARPASIETAVKAVFGIDYERKSNNRYGKNTEQDRGVSLAGNSEAGAAGNRVGPGGFDGREREPGGAGASERGRGTSNDSGAGIDVKPVGRGKFGDIFAAFRGKAKAAWQYLSALKSGQARGVFYRPEIGEIDLVWGEAPTPYSGKGLAHIDRKHVKTLGDFASMEEAIGVIDDV